jgi:hypothetical protein
MPPAFPDTATLFATEHGVVDWTSADRLRVALGTRSWRLAPDALTSLHEATQPLAAQVYRCDCDCRWQLRLPGRGTAVLSTDEVLRLHSLLDGAVAMLELDSLLDDASIARPSRQ